MSKLNVYCFPYSGGSATSFYDWKKKFGSIANINTLEYKGHGSRMDQDLYLNNEEAVEDMTQCILADHSDNIVLLGYSYGSRVALETAFVLREKGVKTLALILAAERPPHLKYKDRHLGQKTRDEAMKEIIKMGQIPDELIECEELYELFSEIIYSDLKLNDSFEHDMNTPVLDIPIYIFRGTNDKETPNEDMEEYSKYTADENRVISVEGGHFFAFENPGVFDKELVKVLTEIKNSVERD